MKSAIESFYVAILDDDRKLISVRGPMTDDSSITRGVADARAAGRRIHCFTARPGATKEEILAEFTGYAQSAAAL